MRAPLRRGLGAVLAVGAAALAIAPIPMLTGNASAAAPVPTTSAMTLQCQTLDFPVYDWDAEVSVTAQTDGTDTYLLITPNDLPGIVPLNVSSAENEGTIIVEVDGVRRTLTGFGTTSIARNQPVAIPPVSGLFASSAASIDVVIKKITYNTKAGGGVFPTLCPATAAAETTWAVGAVAVETTATLPTPAPTPTPSAKPSPSVTPSPTVEESKGTGKKKGVAAKGTANFSCILQTLQSPFDYKPTVSVSGTRAKADDTEVTITAKFSDIPGLAPLPIENGPMKITAAALIDGKEVAFAGSATVNAPMYGKVAVPPLITKIETDKEQLSVEITAFKFDFGEMAGAQIYSECEGGGKLSRMTVGVGAEAEEQGGGGDGNGVAGGGDALPRTGAGAPFAAIGLWGGALALFGAAVFLLVPRSRTEIRH